MHYRFKIARERAGFSQKAASIYLGISTASMSEWENEKTCPTVSNLIKMANLYKTSVDYLLATDSINDESTHDLYNKVQNDLKDLDNNELQRVSDFISGIKHKLKE